MFLHVIAARQPRLLEDTPHANIAPEQEEHENEEDEEGSHAFFPTNLAPCTKSVERGVVRSSRATHTTTPVPAVIFRGHLHFEPAFLPESASRSCAYLADSRYHSRLHSSNPNNPLTNKHNHTNQEHRRASAMKPRIRLLFRRVV